MLYDFFTGHYSLTDALLDIVATVGARLISDYAEAISFFKNFVDNIRTVLDGNITVGRIVRILPDFASMLIAIMPGMKVAKIIASTWDIGLSLYNGVKRS